MVKNFARGKDKETYRHLLFGIGNLMPAESDGGRK
jgi:hypothetical protein